ncbi:hypothetical protein EKO04_005160 [Ascochyta lentis]|uniref:Urea carboxylase n=1 Tax=Ascochyta lentis TaxID=205686 RepID=A0A8H7J3U4_9PLEO|nr:hypothetical protein EKO04_005160 [Ascochyta lentis]
MHTIRSVLIANRGEIAVRCIQACRKLGVTSVAIFTEVDATSLHVSLADRTVLLKQEGSRAFTDIKEILRICEEEHVDAVIPGYGFLSENHEFAHELEAKGILFIGPSAKVIKSMGLKHVARELAIAAGVPVVPGSELLMDSHEAKEASEQLGFPIMLKASGGGGGMGTHVCWGPDEVDAAFLEVQSTSRKLFHDMGVFLERFYPKSHHIEVQIFGNGSEVVHFGERECSIQRRRQKVIEECPSPFLKNKPDLRARLLSCAISLGKLVAYESAGTVEFLVDDSTGDFFFLEMNTRLQVEHGITELCYDVDLVVLMIRQADLRRSDTRGIPSHELLNLQKEQPRGTAIELRVCCENPAVQFQPSAGIVQELSWPKSDQLRVDTWITTGSSISSYFDSLLAKVIVQFHTRDHTIQKLTRLLPLIKIRGVCTNLSFLASIIASEAFQCGSTLTTFLDDQFQFHPTGILVETPGTFTTIQQARPRTRKGYGIPAGGPMDDLSAKVANLLVDNPADTECLEVTTSGPELYFYNTSLVAVCGAQFEVKVDGVHHKLWSQFIVNRGQRLQIGTIKGQGARCYVAVKGGFPQSPSWLGSKSTTPNLGLGGLQGRELQVGDFLELQDIGPIQNLSALIRLPRELLPSIGDTGIFVMHGPHDSDEFITNAGRDALYSTPWKIDHNCSRTGIRLIGPAIEWNRTDGGEGGAHPSNLIDYPYPSPGGINWTGDSPVIFPTDGPGFGGFLTSSTVISADLWKLGQLKPGDEIRLHPIQYSMAREAAQKVELLLSNIRNYVQGDMSVSPVPELPKDHGDTSTDAVLLFIEGNKTTTSLTLRQGGDRFIIADLGHQKVSLEISIAANLLARRIKTLGGPECFVHVNVSSVMVEYDSEKISQNNVTHLIQSAYQTSQTFAEKMPCRKLELPIVFDHPSIQEAETRYSILQRSTATYLPDNVDYMRKNNGLDSRDSVFQIFRTVRFVVIAVGFMTGLPLLLPLDPLARMTAQKHNPTRTFTPAGAVGFGGPLACIYPADLPGGYMLIGRTLPVWDTFALRGGFSKNCPWLCEPFDIVEFHEVDVNEYERLASAFRIGTYEHNVSDTVFDVQFELNQERRFVGTTAFEEFMMKRQAASTKTQLEEEALYARWRAESRQGISKYDEPSVETCSSLKVMARQNGRLWKVLVEEGDNVAEGSPLFILEAMKMEVTVFADSSHDGLTVTQILKHEGALLSPSSIVILLD